MSDIIKQYNYDDGFKTGRRWNESYRPGGPWRCTDTRWPEAVATDKANAEEWFRGFDDGVAAQNKESK